MTHLDSFRSTEIAYRSAAVRRSFAGANAGHERARARRLARRARPQHRLARAA